MSLFLYQLKLLIRNKSLLFWSLLFPLILATFFKLAFSNILDSEHFEPAQTAIVEITNNDSFNQVIQQLSNDSDNPLLDVQYVSLDQAKELLKKDQVDGYIVIDEEIELFVNQNGISQSIIQTVIDRYYSFSHTINTIYTINPQTILKDIDMSQDYFKDNTFQNSNVTVIYFYTLIGMNCMFACYSAISATTKMEGNLSRQGTRVIISPVSQEKMIISMVISVFIIHYLKMLVLLGYLIYGLHVEFGNQFGYIALLMAVGSFVGISLGCCINSLMKGNENTKTTIGTTISLLCSFFAGMMIIDIKYLVLEYFPIAAYINPVSLITDALYSLYYYTTYDRYFFNILCLLVIGILLLFVSILYMRRKQYDSL